MTKKCSLCGRKFSACEWRQLHLVGYQENCEGGWLELRNCTCTSTLSVQVASKPARPETAAGCTKVAATN